MRIATTVLMVAALAATPVAAQTCRVSDVQPSAKVRELQSVLMVGALQCRSQPGSTVLADYNRFIASQKQTLQFHNSALRAHFVQASGRNGAADFDRFTTRLANAHAQSASAGGFCDMVTRVVQAAADVAPADLPAFAQSILPESAACIVD